MGSFVKWTIFQLVRNNLVPGKYYSVVDNRLRKWPSEEMSDEGRIPESPIVSRRTKRKSLSGAVKGRADACVEFALDRESFKSLDIFVSKKKRANADGSWCPSKGQMVRDMKKIFGDDWAARRGRVAGVEVVVVIPCVLRRGCIFLTNRSYYLKRTAALRLSLYTRNELLSAHCVSLKIAS